MVGLKRMTGLMASAALLVPIGFTSTLLADAVFYDGFEGYPAGLSPSSPSWTNTSSASVTVRVDSTTAYGGSQSLYFLDTTDSGGARLKHNFGSATAIQVDYYMRSDNRLYEGPFVGLVGNSGAGGWGESLGAVAFGGTTGGGAADWIGFIYAGWPEQHIMQYTTGTWYKVSRSIDLAQDKEIVRVYDTKTGASAQYNRSGIRGPNTTVDGLDIWTSSSQYANSYLDEITVRAITPGSISPANPNKTPGAQLKNTSLSGNLRRWVPQEGGLGSWQPVTSTDESGVNPALPTVVIAHGWYGAIDNANWTADMAKKFYQQNPAANILGYDWSDAACSVTGVHAPEATRLYELQAIGLAGAYRTARLGSIQGAMLAMDLCALGVHDDTLQLIGHSNGGAVIGSAASWLATTGTKVKRLTTLDTPNLSLSEVPEADALIANKLLLLTSVNATKYIDDKSVDEVEAYYSNGIEGRAALGFGSPLTDTGTQNVFNGRIYPGPKLANFEWSNLIDHSRITNWYMGEPGAGDIVGGISRSILAPECRPWVSGAFTEQGRDTRVFGTSTIAEQQVLKMTTLAIETFEQGAEWSGLNAAIMAVDGIGQFVAKITNGSDGHLFKEVTVPQEAYFLSFDLQVEVPSAEDFLTVSFGDEILFYKRLVAADTGMVSIDPIFIGDFAGKTDTLLFSLNHMGPENTSILVDNIAFSSVPEPASLSLLALGGLAVLRRKRK